MNFGYQRNHLLLCKYSGTFATTVINSTLALIYVLKGQNTENNILNGNLYFKVHLYFMGHLPVAK